MDTAKLRKVLELALHPNTEQAESEAALKAARRMMGHKHLDEIIRDAQQSVNKPKGSNSPFERAWQITMPGKWQHSFTEQVFLDAQKLGLHIWMLSYKPVDPTHWSTGTLFKFKVMGDRQSVEKLARVIDLYIQEVNKEAPARKPAPRAPHPRPESPKPKGWFSKWFSK